MKQIGIGIIVVLIQISANAAEEIQQLETIEVIGNYQI